MRMGRARLVLIVTMLRLVRWLCARKRLVAWGLRRPRIRSRLERGLAEGGGAEAEAFLETALTDFASPGVPDAIGAGARDQSHERVGELSMPTHLVWGSRDPVLPVRLAVALQAQIPGSTLDVVEGSGHLPMIERPRAFEQLLLDRLRDTENPPPA
jgi:pimeloyl-ACP methyl ester carboxylesterase